MYHHTAISLLRARIHHEPAWRLENVIAPRLWAIHGLVLEISHKSVNCYAFDPRQNVAFRKAGNVSPDDAVAAHSTPLGMWARYWKMCSIWVRERTLDASRTETVMAPLELPSVVIESAHAKTAIVNLGRPQSQSFSGSLQPILC